MNQVYHYYYCYFFEKGKIQLPGYLVVSDGSFLCRVRLHQTKVQSAFFLLRFLHNFPFLPISYQNKKDVFLTIETFSHYDQSLTKKIVSRLYYYSDYLPSCYSIVVAFL